MLDITITATQRHEILRRTLESFKKNLFKDYPIRSININIDPVGPDKDHSACLEVCLDIFANVDVKQIPTNSYIMPEGSIDTIINYRAPEKPNFAEGFKWAWNEARTNFVFHLEDDWELLREIDLNEMINMLNKHEDLALLRLPQFRSTEKTMKNWNLFYPWSGEYFKCPLDLVTTAGFCGHPSLIKGEFVQNTAPYIDITKNPEKQFHHGPKEIMEEVAKWKFGVYSQPNMPAAIADIGRKWSVETGWQKKGPKAWFLEWEKGE